MRQLCCYFQRLRALHIYVYEYEIYMENSNQLNQQA